MSLIADAVDGWAAGLAAAVQSTRALARTRRRLRFERADGEVRLVDEAGKERATFALEGDVATSASANARSLRGCDVEVRIPAGAVMERNLDPLPRESRPYLENIVRHRLDRVFPWRAGEIVYQTVPADRSDGMIDVTVLATPKRPLADAFAVARAVDAARLVVVAVPGDGDDDHAAREIIVPVRAETDAGGALKAARYAILGVLLAGALGVGWTRYETWALERQLEEVNQAIEGRRTVLARAAAQRDGEDADGLQAMKRDSAAAVVLLEVLSGALPDDTYLTDLDIDQGRLRLSGISGGVTDLVPLLQDAGHLTEVTFFAPTVRLPDSSRDRFNIEAVIVPGQTATP